MKKILLFSLMLTALEGVLTACSKDEELAYGSYYIRYEVLAGSDSLNRTSDDLITYQTADSVEWTSYISNTSFEKTCGPFNKGDRVFLNCMCFTPNGYQFSRVVRISVYEARTHTPDLKHFNLVAEANGLVEYTIR